MITTAKIFMTCHVSMSNVLPLLCACSANLEGFSSAVVRRHVKEHLAVFPNDFLHFASCFNCLFAPLGTQRNAPIRRVYVSVLVDIA